jgi:hypothetical protein
MPLCGEVGRMNPMIALPFEGGHVALQPDDRGWCDVTIMTAGRSRRFGAEGIGAIARHILGRLPNCDAIGEIEGVPVINLLNLCELHGSIYLEATAAPSRRLFFQDGEVHVILGTSVSAEQLDLWESSLLGFQDVYMQLSDA